MPTFFPILPSLPVNKLYLPTTSIAEDMSFSFYSVIETVMKKSLLRVNPHITWYGKSTLVGVQVCLWQDFILLIRH